MTSGQVNNQRSLFFPSPMDSELNRKNAKRFVGQNDNLLRDFFNLNERDLTATRIQDTQSGVLNPVSDAEDDDEAAGDCMQGSVCMCMIYQSRRFACALYDFNSKSVSYLPDFEDDGSFSLANLLISDMQPDTVITCTKSEGEFIKYLKIKCKYNNLEDNNPDFLHRDANRANQDKVQQHAIKFVMMANCDFSYECACELIYGIDSLEDMHGHVIRGHERSLYFKNLLNFDSKQMIRCLGALLKHLERSESHDDSLNGLASPILNIKPIKLDNLLTIDQNTYKSLQIFTDVDLSYANRQVMPEYAGHFRTTLNYKMNTSSTLYSLYLSKVHTKAGTQKLRSFMLRPTREPGVISERHAVIEFFMDKRNQRGVELFSKELKRCKFITALFKKMRISTCNLNEWKKLYNTTAALCDIAVLGRAASVSLKKKGNRRNQQQQHDSVASQSISAFTCLGALDNTSVNFVDQASRRSKYFATTESMSEKFSSINVRIII
jgi:DNA mismatch repair ATPase MutS